MGILNEGPLVNISKALSDDGPFDAVKARVQELEAALQRADGIINWMANYIGKMVPPDDGIYNLNQHWLYMQR